MLTDWSARDCRYLLPAVLMVGFILLFSWLGPMGVSAETYYDMTLWGVAGIVQGVILRAAVRKREAEGVSLTVFASVPPWVWMVFTAGHGVIVGMVLAMAMQFDFTVMMLGGAVVAAPFGLLLHRGLKEGLKVRMKPGNDDA